MESESFYVILFKVGACGFALEIEQKLGDYTHTHICICMCVYACMYINDLQKLIVYSCPKELHLVWKKGTSPLPNGFNL